jgi:hypothetical protein
MIHDGGSQLHRVGVKCFLLQGLSLQDTKCLKETSHPEHVGK